MSPRNWSGRLGDMINPIVVKELRQAVRGRFVVTLLILSLLSQMIIVIGAMIGQRLESTAIERSPAGAGLFMTIFTVLFFGTVVLIPLYAGLRMMAERSDTNVDLLFITTIRPRSVVIGKILATAIITALIYSASIPFLVFSYVLRGIDFVSIVIVTLSGFFFVVSQTIVALFIGALPASRPFKLLLAVGLFGCSISATFLMSSFASEFIRFGIGIFGSASSRNLGSGLAAMLAVTALLDLLLVFLTTALVSPPSANRALPIRVFLTVLWGTGFALATWSSVQFVSTAALVVWAIFFLGIGALVLFSAIGEREEWGPRVARTIPLPVSRRIIAFLFFSGGGGTIWALLMMASTVALFAAVAPLYGGPSDAVATHNATIWMAEACMCVAAYAGSALLLRRTMLANRVPARATWAVVLALFVLLAIIPPLAAFALEDDSNGFSVYIHIATIANPFPMTSPPHPWTPKTITLAVWAAIAILANARWIGMLFDRFRGPDRDSGNRLIVTEQSA